MFYVYILFKYYYVIIYNNVKIQLIENQCRESKTLFTDFVVLKKAFKTLFQIMKKSGIRE